MFNNAIPQDKIEFLVFYDEGFKFGIDLEEVGTISMITKQSEDHDRFVRELKEAGILYELSSLFDKLRNNPKHFYLTIKKNKSPDIFIAIDEIEGVITFSLKDILLVPPLIKKLQKPFLVWGFGQRQEELIILLTLKNLEGGSYASNKL